VKADPIWAARLYGRRVDCGIDSQLLLHYLKNGGGKCPILNDIIKDILDEQVALQCVLEGFYVNTKLNASDVLTRENPACDMVLEKKVWRCVRRFAQRCARTPFTHDFMASDVDAKAWSPGVPLPHFTRYHTPLTHGVNVMVQDIGQQGMFGYCFPPPNMVGAVLEHIVECKAHVVLVAANDGNPWWPKLVSLATRAMIVCATGHIVAWLPGSHGYVKCPLTKHDYWAFYFTK